MSTEHRPGRSSHIRERIRGIIKLRPKEPIDPDTNQTEKVKPLTLEEYLGAILPSDFRQPLERKPAQQGADPDQPLTLREYLGALFTPRKKRP